MAEQHDIYIGLLINFDLFPFVSGMFYVWRFETRPIIRVDLRASATIRHTWNRIFQKWGTLLHVH